MRLVTVTHEQKFHEPSEGVRISYVETGFGKHHHQPAEGEGHSYLLWPACLPADLGGSVQGFIVDDKTAQKVAKPCPDCERKV